MSLHLFTPRLRLRPLTRADAAFLIELNADPEVIRWVGDGPLADLDAAIEFVDYLVGRQYPFGMGRLLVEEESVPVGWCGLRRLVEGEVPDLGYRFLRSAWGRGLATEAAITVLDAGFARDDVTEVLAGADRRNPRSIRVMERVGMRWFRDFEDELGPAVEYRLDRETWVRSRMG